MQALGVASEGAVRERLTRQLAADYPFHRERLGHDGLNSAVEGAFSWGPTMDIRTYGAIGVLAELLLVYGPELKNAPDRAWALRTLREGRLPAQLRVRLVRDRLDAKAKGRVIVRQGGPEGGDHGNLS